MIFVFFLGGEGGGWFDFLRFFSLFPFLYFLQPSFYFLSPPPPPLSSPLSPAPSPTTSSFSPAYDRRVERYLYIYISRERSEGEKGGFYLWRDLSMEGRKEVGRREGGRGEVEGRGERVRGKEVERGRRGGEG